MSDRHEEIRRDLGVYVLGALEPEHRDRLEGHLAECSLCREELAELAVLPTLLARVGQPPAAAAGDPPAFEPIVARLAALRRRERRRQWTLAAAAVLAGVVAAVSIVAGLPSGSGAGVAYLGEDAGVTATLEERGWGMAMHLDVRDLPPRPGYIAVAVADDGHRTQVASWSRTEGPTEITGACYLKPDEVDRLEIVAPDEEVLTVLRSAAP